MRQAIANASTNLLSVIGRRGSYHCSALRQQLEITDATRAYIAKGLFESDGKIVSPDALKDKDTAQKVKLLNLLPDELIRLMTEQKTRVAQYTYKVEPSDGKAKIPLKIQFGWWRGSENKIIIYEAADQILGLGAKHFIPLLNKMPQMKNAVPVFAVYKRYGVNMSDVAFAHEAGHMLHLKEWDNAGPLPMPPDALMETKDRLAQFTDSGGLGKLKQSFDARFPGREADWEKVVVVAQAFRFALDTDSAYLKRVYPGTEERESVATMFALKQTLFRHQPELLNFMLPKMDAYISALQQRAYASGKEIELEDPGHNQEQTIHRMRVTERSTGEIKRN